MNDVDFFAGIRPELATLAKVHRERCEKAGLRLVFLWGLRSWGEQMELYGHGRVRTSAGWKMTNRKEVVTDGLPDESPHCRGAAYDCAPLDLHEKIDWKRLDLFDAVAKMAPPGLVWGGTFPIHDLDHFELPRWRSLPLPETALPPDDDLDG